MVGSERPGIYELEELATVLRPTSVLRPKVVSRLSELAGSWAPDADPIDDMLTLVSLNVPAGLYQLFLIRVCLCQNRLTFSGLTTVP